MATITCSLVPDHRAAVCRGRWKLAVKAGCRVETHRVEAPEVEGDRAVALACIKLQSLYGLEGVDFVSTGPGYRAVIER